MDKIDLGYNYGSDMPTPESKDNKVYYPEFHIDGMNVNLGKSVGTDFIAKVELCLTSIRKKDNGDYSYGVEVKSIILEDECSKEFGELLEEAVKGE